jgi:hypothetical protein
MFAANCLNCSVHYSQLQTLNHVPKFQTHCVTLCCQVSVKHLALCAVSSEAQRTSKHSKFWGEFFFFNICRLHPCGNGIAQSVQWLLYGLEDRGSNPGRGNMYIYIYTTCGPALGTTQPHNRWLSGGSFSWVGGKAAVAWIKYRCFLVGAHAWSCNGERQDCSGTAEVGKWQWVSCGRFGVLIMVTSHHYATSSNSFLPIIHFITYCGPVHIYYHPVHCLLRLITHCDPVH